MSFTEANLSQAIQKAFPPVPQLLVSYIRILTGKYL